MKNKYKFNFQIDESLLVGIKNLQEIFSIENCKEGITVRAETCAEGIEILGSGKEILIRYAKKNLFFFALSFCMENYGKSFSIIRKCAVNRLGIMRDCARNAIISYEGVKKLTASMALLGYDYLELYIEDLMEISELPYLGHNRGRYSSDQIKTYDDFASSLGIELVPCIQTLAHLPHIFRHNVFFDIRDNADILLVGEDKTYAFIDKILDFCERSFSSKRINIGMDEAHNMCEGKYKKIHGRTEDRSEVFMKHLYKVLELCKKHSLKPSMWSDMIFKVAFGITTPEAYIGTEGKKFSKKFALDFPKDVNLIFWDYYHTNKDFYDSIFKAHYELTDNVSFAGGTWTWQGFVPMNTYAEMTLKPAIESCIENNCKDFMVTAWGDGGGECSTFMALSSFAYVSEKLFNGNIEELDNRMESVFGNTYSEFKNFENANKTCPDSIIDRLKNNVKINVAKYVLYNDPLVGVLDKHVYPELSKYFNRNYSELKGYADKGGVFSYAFKSMSSLCKVLTEKATLGLDIKNAYKNKDIDTLKQIYSLRIPKIILMLNNFYNCYRTQWLNENKSFGFEITGIRIGGLIYRLKETKNVLKEYCNGKIKIIEELEQPRLTVCDFMSEQQDIGYNSFCLGMSGSDL